MVRNPKNEKINNFNCQTDTSTILTVKLFLTENQYIAVIMDEAYNIFSETFNG